MMDCGSIMLDKFRGMNLISRFPCVVAFRVALPFDEILELLLLSELLVCDYPFNLVFVFSVNEVRWWSGKVGAVGLCFMIRHQQGRMEYVVDSPVSG